MQSSKRILNVLLGVASVAALVACGDNGAPAGETSDAAAAAPATVTLVNVSYDPTRELYAEYNKAFAEYWKKEKGQDVTIDNSHGGSGKQAQKVIDGLDAAVVTLALAYDIDKIVEGTNPPKLAADWQKSFAQNSAPYTSTIVFLVRKGNPKNLKDWGDLAKPGIEVITPNPKTSGGARWNYLAAWAWALKQHNNDQDKAKAFVAALFKNVKKLDTGARGSTDTFNGGRGDVLLAWENEAFLSINELGADKIEIVVPTLSILAEPPVAVVDAVARAHGTEELAKAYLQYLYSDEGQRIAAKNFYRPRNEAAANPEDVKRFVKVELVTIDDVFGGWQKAQKEHFSDGGVFDRIYSPEQQKAAAGK